MKVGRRVKLDIEVTGIRLEVPVRYGEEDIPNDFPFRDGDLWRATVDGATGRIKDWPAGVTAEFYMKVVDQGVYRLLGPDGVVVATIDQDYVPPCIPGEWGDYIDFDIGPDGTVARWAAYWTPENVRASFFRE